MTNHFIIIKLNMYKIMWPFFLAGFYT